MYPSAAPTSSGRGSTFILQIHLTYTQANRTKTETGFHILDNTATCFLIFIATFATLIISS